MLLRQAARRSSAVYDEALAPLGVTVAQFSLLRKVARAGAISLTELARLADLDRSTMGRNAKVLRRMGWIAEADSDDHRETTVTLTEAGRDLVARGGPLWDKAQADVEARLGDGGAEALRALLDAI